MKSEKEIQKDICKMLQKSPDIAFYIVNTTGLFKRGKYNYSIGKWIRQNIKGENHDGLSDITGMLSKERGGKFFAFEVKTEIGTASDEQKEFIAFVLANGGVAGVVRSVQDVEMLLMGYSINL